MALFDQWRYSIEIDWTQQCPVVLQRAITGCSCTGIRRCVPSITCQSHRSSALSVHWKDWCCSWSSNILATWCEELTHWKRPWCWERLKAGGEGGDRGWDGWMASPTQWTWVWVSSGSWWWTGKPGVLQSTGPQRVRRDFVTEPQHWHHWAPEPYSLHKLGVQCTLSAYPAVGSGVSGAYTQAAGSGRPRSRGWPALCPFSPGVGRQKQRSGALTSQQWDRMGFERKAGYRGKKAI